MEVLQPYAMPQANKRITRQHLMLLIYNMTKWMWRRRVIVVAVIIANYFLFKILKPELISPLHRVMTSTPNNISQHNADDITCVKLVRAKPSSYSAELKFNDIYISSSNELQISLDGMSGDFYSNTIALRPSNQIMICNLNEGGISNMGEVMPPGKLFIVAFGYTTIYATGNITFSLSGNSSISTYANATVHIHGNFTIACSDSTIALPVRMAAGDKDIKIQSVNEDFDVGQVILSGQNAVADFDIPAHHASDKNNFSISSNSTISAPINAKIYALKGINLSHLFSPTSFRVRTATEDLAIQKESFLSKYVECDLSKSEVSLGRSCGLTLNVDSTAKDSLDFDYMHRQVELRREEELQKRPAAFMPDGAVKNILVWFERFHERNQFGDQQYFQRCPVKNCQITANRTLVSPDEVNAIIMDQWWLCGGGGAILPERERYPNAKMVLLSYEAPSRYPANDFARYDGLVDYTMGYRLDSDILRTHGAVHFKLNPAKTKNDVLQNPNPHPMKKMKMAAWFVTNCKYTPSNRMELAKALQQQGVQVDIYGGCGSLQCGKKRNEDCYKMVEQEYKFYLSFENSLCNHYVTEKFFTLLRYDVVPVTWGLGHELTGAPKDAYIDVFDFPDVKTLAAYLLYLNSNATAYNAYFRWKQFYEVQDNPGGRSVICKLCEILVRGIKPKRQYTNVQAWLSNGQCINVTENEKLGHFINGSPT